MIGPDPIPELSDEDQEGLLMVYVEVVRIVRELLVVVVLAFVFGMLIGWRLL